MTKNSFRAELVSVMLGDAAFFRGQSIVRLAASAYRSDRTATPRDEIDRRWAIDGEVTVKRIGSQFFLLEPHEFDCFRGNAAKEKA
ncbi:hypothetical protein [Burkholderia sp. BC1]|uniref:hypothetical protein n=1 Tax=Burkholderia sp. BC1 TaxID=1095370 RepID=UPI004044AB16